MKNVIILFEQLLLTVFMLTPCRAQETSVGLDDFLELQAERYNDEEIDNTQLADYYLELLKHPLNINIATKEQLEGLLFLTDFQIYSILNYRITYGKFLTKHELDLLHGFDKETIRRLLPFICLEPILEDKKQRTKSFLKLRSSRNLEKQAGYRVEDPSKEHYLGSSNYLYLQYRYTASKVHANLTAEKDAGEEFFEGSNKQGFDYYSFCFALKNLGFVKHLIIGDYRAAFGQGLCIQQTFSLGKSADVLGVKQRLGGLIPYGSTDENRFMRGLALVLGHKQWTLSCFVSAKKIDASTTSDSANIYYSSLLLSGLHRTKREIERKQSLKERLIGVNLTYRTDYFRAGLTTLGYKYGGENTKEVQPYNLFELRKPENANISADFQYLYRNITLFGEMGISSNGGKAIIAGTLLDMSRYAQLSLVYRNYSPAYQAVYASSFGQLSKTANEEGIYLGLNFQPFNAWRLAAYFDSYKFPWLTYQLNTPSSAWDYLVQLSYQPQQDFHLYLRFKQRSSEKNTSKEVENVIQRIKTSQIKVNAIYTFSPQLSMQTSMAYNYYQPEFGTNEKGVLLFHDINYTLPSFPLTFALRYAIFNTSGWNTRFYTYERNILHVFSIPAYYDKGSRYYLNAGWKINTFLQLWLRFSQTVYNNRTTIGSGLSQIRGNKQSEVKAQLMFRF